MCAAFAAFKPAAVEAAVTGGWAKTNAATLLDARLAGATAQLERLIGDIAAPADVARADRDALRADRRRRPVRPDALLAGLSALPRPTTPFGALWHAADLVREHRGDGHIAAWIPHVDSTEITVLTELAWGIPPRSYVFTRGWSAEEVDAAYARLTGSRAASTASALTAAGTELREPDRAGRPTESNACGRSSASPTTPTSCSRCCGRWPRRSSTGGGYPADPKNLARQRLTRAATTIGSMTETNRDGVAWTPAQLRDPVLVAGFTGWNDAADAASDAVDWLARHFDARPSSPRSTRRSTSTSRPTRPTVELRRRRHSAT